MRRLAGALVTANFLPVSSYFDRSFDGRYMGAVPTAKRVGQSGHPLLTFLNHGCSADFLYRVRSVGAIPTRSLQ